MTKRGRAERPTLPILNIDMSTLGTAQGYAVAVFEVTALILHPHDKTARASFVMSASFDLLEKWARKMSPPGVVTISGKAREIEIRPPEKIISEALAPVLKKIGDNRKIDPNSPFHGPAVAMAILRRALILADRGEPEIGIEKILTEQSAAYKKQGLKGVGRDRLVEIWYEYRSVAHVAAAFNAIRVESLDDRRVFFRWIGLANDLLKMGSQIGDRFAEPILPSDKCWRIDLTPSSLGEGRPEISRASFLSTPRKP